MAGEEIVDPLSKALADLRAATPREAQAKRVRRRCHAELATLRARNEPAARSLSVADLLMASGAAFYALASISHGVRLLLTAVR